MADIYVCKHCGGDASGVYCNLCNTADKRREMDLANKEIRKNEGKEWICKVCELGWYSIFTKTYSSGLIEKIKQ